MRRAAMWSAVAVAALFLQVTLVPFVSVGNVKPDLPLVVVVCAALLGGARRGAVLGAGTGLLTDLVSAHTLGVGMLANMVIGYVVGLAEQQVFKENVFLPMFALLVATVAHGLLFFGTLFLLGQPVYWRQAAVYGTVLPAVYNAFVAVFIHPVVYRLDRWRPFYE